MPSAEAESIGAAAAGMRGASSLVTGTSLLADMGFTLATGRTALAVGRAVASISNPVAIVAGASVAAVGTVVNAGIEKLKEEGVLVERPREISIGELKANAIAFSKKIAASGSQENDQRAAAVGVVETANKTLGQKFDEHISNPLKAKALSWLLEELLLTPTEEKGAASAHAVTTSSLTADDGSISKYVDVVDAKPKILATPIHTLGRDELTLTTPIVTPVLGALPGFSIHDAPPIKTESIPDQTALDLIREGMIFTVDKEQFRDMMEEQIDKGTIKVPKGLSREEFIDQTVQKFPKDFIASKILREMKPEDMEVATTSKNGVPYKEIYVDKAEKATLGETRGGIPLIRLGYQKLPTKESEHAGTQGIDSAWVRYHESGEVESIIIVESKYAKTGNAKLGTTKEHGEQMSDDWIENHLRTMERSQNPDLDNTRKLIEANLDKVIRKVNVLDAKGNNNWNKIKPEPTKLFKK